jgi:protein arginine kinase activator
MQDVKMGAPFGCSECYRVFEDLIITEMLAENRISKKLAIRAKGMRPIHMGRSIQERTSYNPATRLLALNEALHDTLNREDYEQAALLRDQIKQLVEESDSAK